MSKDFVDREFEQIQDDGPMPMDGVAQDAIEGYGPRRSGQRERDYDSQGEYDPSAENIMSASEMYD